MNRGRKVGRRVLVGVSIGLAMVLVAPGGLAPPTVIGVLANLASLPPFPEGIAVGPDGNLYVSLVTFSALSKILVVSREGKTLGEITVAAGPGGQANLLGEAFDEDGNLYVADFADAFAPGSCLCNGRVVRISPEGDMATVASGLTFPNALAFDASGNLFISDSFLGRIWRVSPGAAPSVFVDSELLRAHNPPAGFPPVGANGIAFTRSDGSLLVANTVDGTVVQIPLGVDGAAGTPAILATGLFGADGIASDVMGNIYVALNPQNKIALVSPTGTLSATYSGTGDNALRNPASLAFKGRTLYVTDFALFSGGTPGISAMTAQFPGAPLA